MSYEPSNERVRSARGFRTSLDIGMGIFYVIIGSMLIMFRSFANRPIPTWVAYSLGAIMAIGGIFRFYRGMKAVLPRKKG